ncbi:hypothetical protein D910_00879, partial [Dendroctonus ponderosae]
MSAPIVICLIFILNGAIAQREFPGNFKFGTAGASYQIEGGYNEDGRGPSMWDTFSHIPGNIKNDSNGDIASDSYHKYKEDVAILKNLGVQFYRFSVSWSRIFTNGTPNTYNQAG